eukprot:1946928-Rhodomonas_salina.1
MWVEVFDFAVQRSRVLHPRALHSARSPRTRGTCPQPDGFRGWGQRSKLAEKGRSGLEVARDTRAEERETAREAGGRV